MGSRSPFHRVPWWILFWLTKSPPLFLASSIICFLAGLVLFAYSSGQHRVTSIVTTVLSVFSCLGLAAVACWFAWEWWVWNRHKGRKWLADVLSETRVGLISTPDMAWFIHEPRNVARKVSYWGRRKYHDLSDRFTNAVQIVKDRFRMRRLQQEEDPESPVDSEKKSPTIQSYTLEPVSATTVHGPISETVPSTADGEDIVDNDAGTAAPDYTVASSSTSPAKARLKNAVRLVMMMSAGASPLVATPSQKRTVSSDASRGKLAEKAISSQSRIAELVPILKKMEVTQDVAAHVSLVRHIQFSPDGRFLATSRYVVWVFEGHRLTLRFSWDRTSVVFRVGVRGNLCRYEMKEFQLMYSLCRILSNRIVSSPIQQVSLPKWHGD